MAPTARTPAIVQLGMPALIQGPVCTIRVGSLVKGSEIRIGVKVIWLHALSAVYKIPQCYSRQVFLDLAHLFCQKG